MTGKFHKSWGDFNSLKTPAALEYECFMMLAEGAKCSIGDQLHPRGALDPVTYDLIGHVYRQVEAKEPWCAGTEALKEIGLFTPEAIGSIHALKMALKGCADCTHLIHHCPTEAFNTVAMRMWICSKISIYRSA